MRKISVIKKLFGKLLSPFLSDKVRSTNKMTLRDKEKIVVSDYNTAKVLNTFFSNMASKLNIAEYSNCEPLANNILFIIYLFIYLFLYLFTYLFIYLFILFIYLFESLFTVGINDSQSE